MNDKKREINFGIFYRSLFCQKYFIWNDLELKDSQLKNNDDIGDEVFWDLSFDETSELDYVSVHKKGFELMQKEFQEYIINLAKDNKLNLYINSEKTNELKRKKTLVALFDDKIDLILYPQLEYNGAYSTPALYNKKEKKLSNFNFVTSTKAKDLVRAYYDFQIWEALKIPVETFTIFTIKLDDFKKAKDIKFEESQYAYSGKNKKSVAKHDKSISAKKMAAFGLSNTKNKKFDHRTIIEKITRSPLISKAIGPFLASIDSHLAIIEKAREIKTIENRLVMDKNSIGDNPYFLEIAQKINPKFLPISGKIISKDELIANIKSVQLLKSLYLRKKVSKLIYKKQNFIDIEAIREFLVPFKNARIIWYDFEGFSMPFNVLAHTLPYQQIVFQVSIIKTNNEKIYFKNNLVIDPKNISILSFLEIIDAIYDQNANYYVVFNKSYENTRLQEMLDPLWKYFLPRDKTIYYEYEKKIKEIIAKTIDLAIPFKIDSSSKLPSILLYETNGYYSIKKIEKYITNHKLDLELLITPYSELKIQNGFSAMERAISRYLDQIGDLEWKRCEEDLKIYCENDVKAMLMVYFFLKKLSI